MIIGGAFGAIVKSLVEDVFTPLIGMLVGKPDFSGIVLGGKANAEGKIEGGIMLGNFLNATISFLLIATAVYLFIIVPLKRYQAMTAKPAAPAAPAAPPEDIVLLREIRDALKKG